ncbi:hypothetical protein HDV02_002427 [Globomyces sp. JEL0801]|nr:hypothetical protein HDV02_002427 [Globomyces sp. JEL0801]
MSQSDKQNAVESVIAELGLKDCADTLIGDHERKGISVGEKRRVSIGCQLLANPSILFLDEPTTGLDAFTSYNLIKTLKQLTQKGRSIFITIHQPRYDIFQLFDSLVLLAKGQLIYSGQSGDTLFNYLKEIEFPCPEDVNPADHLIDLVSVDDRSKELETQTLKKVHTLTKYWKKKIKSKEFLNYEYPVNSNGNKSCESFQPVITHQANLSQSISTSQPMAGRNPPQDSSNVVVLKIDEMDNFTTPKRTVSQLTQTIILIKRNWKNLTRDRLQQGGLLLEVICVSLFISLIFFQLKDDLSGVLSRKSALYVLSTSQPYLMLSCFVFKIVNDMQIYDRERSDNLFGVVPYLLSQYISQLPFNIFFPALYSIMTYFMIGFRTDDFAIHFTRFMVGNILTHLIIISYSQATVSIIRNYSTASLVANALFSFFMLSTGYLIQLDSLPSYIKWLNNVSFTTFQYRLLTSNEFSDNTYACREQPSACLGNNTLNSLGIAINEYSSPILSMVAIFCFFNIVSVFALLLIPKLPKISFGMTSSTKHILKDSMDPIDSKSLSRRIKKRITVTLTDLSLELVTRSIWPGNTTTTSKQLLQNINAEFKPRALSIIMGGSGTGKSTLLNVLCGRKLHTDFNTSCVQIGSVAFNNIVESDGAKIASICGYVQQNDDQLLSSLTARETLRFAAVLRLPKDMAHHRKMATVEEMLRTLGLKSCANNLVGDEHTKGLSGGERRRLSIGIQLLSDPNVLIIDEPTSGLDAFTSLQIMDTLKDIAKSGRTVICSIHQPRHDIYRMFDSVLLLCKGGRVAYNGPTKLIEPYFNSQGFWKPKFCNPADFILDITSIDYRTSQSESKTKSTLDNLILNWTLNKLDNLEAGHSNEVQSSSPLKIMTCLDENGNLETNEEEMRMLKFLCMPRPRQRSNDSDEDSTLSTSSAQSLSDLDTSSVVSGTTDHDEFEDVITIEPVRVGKPVLFMEKLPQPLMISCPILTHRSFLNLRRKPTLLCTRILQVVALGIIQVLFYTRIGTDQAGVQNRLGALQQTFAVMFVGVLNCVALFPNEKKTLIHEHHDRIYSLWSFFLSYIIIEIPMEIISSILFNILAFWVVGMNTTLFSLFCSTITTFCLLNFGESVGLIFCAIANHSGFSLALTNSVLGIVVLMTGIMSTSIPMVLDIFNQLSPVPYLARVITMNEFSSSSQFTCTDIEKLSNQCFYQNGTSVIDILNTTSGLMDFHVDSVTLFLVLGVTVTLLYRVIAFIVLRLNFK